MGLRECGSEVRFWLEACGSDWETDSPWILARWVWGNVDWRSGFGRRCVDWKCVDWTENLTYRGSDRDWEMERKLTVGLRLALVGLWVELWGMRVECTAMRSACESLCCCEECAAVRELRPCCVRSGNCLKWKYERKWLYGCFGLFYGQRGKAFQLTEFTGSTKHSSFTEKHFRK